MPEGAGSPQILHMESLKAVSFGFVNSCRSISNSRSVRTVLRNPKVGNI